MAVWPVTLSCEWRSPGHRYERSIEYGADPPTLQRLRSELDELEKNICHKVDAQRFVDYYASNGWKVGKNPMKDWKAAVRTWERNGFGSGRRSAGTQDVEIDTNNPFLKKLMEGGYVGDEE